MNRKALITALIILTAVLVAELIFVGVMHVLERSAALQAPPTESTEPATEDTTLATEATEVTEAPTEAPTEPETEPTEPEPEVQRYVLTFTGDCTLGSPPNGFYSSLHFIQTIGEDYDHPFRMVREYFENDDFTMINLESVLADSGTGADKTFVFRGPTAYTNILTGSSVEAVTLANNHTMDFGTAGYKSTKAALEEACVAYVETNGTMLYTTESGLTIGVYAACFTINESDMRSDIAKLREQGAEIVIAALHWGSEGQYRPNANQEKYGHMAIDAGADIVYGHHPHVLQKIEEYNGGIIYYSLGNFSFGGNTAPRDRDSAIVQQEIIRGEDGKVTLGELTIIPVSISSIEIYNNYQPIPYEEGTKEYDRTLSKLDGTFDGPDLVVDYSHLENPTESTEPDSGDSGETEAPGGDTPPETQPGSDAGGDAGGDSGNDSGGDAGADTGSDSGSTGSDSGSTGGETPQTPPAGEGSE